MLRIQAKTTAICKNTHTSTIKKNINNNKKKTNNKKIFKLVKMSATRKPTKEITLTHTLAHTSTAKTKKILRCHSHPFLMFSTLINT